MINIPDDQQLINEFRSRVEKHHRGKTNSVKSHRIEASLKINGLKIRAIVNHLNSIGVWIASCSHGYFYAVTEAERVEYIESLQGRIKGIKNRIVGLINKGK